MFTARYAEKLKIQFGIIMISKGFFSMCGIRFRGFDTVCARVLTTFRRTPSPHIPYDWIITTADQEAKS